MKNKSYHLLTTLVLIFSGACKTITPPTAEVTYVAAKSDVLYLRSTGYGKSYTTALESAQRNAFEVLLFRGIPGSQQSLPLISINEREKDNSKKYFTEFYDQGRYKSFVVHTQTYNDLENTKVGKKITAEVGINLKSLRMDLEHHQIIRKFGY